MASTSSSHQQNAFSAIEPPYKRRKIEESSKVFDVFINHRGPDVKQTLASQLYNSLKALGISPFLDSEEKELGKSFTSIIETAIRSASVHIAIFSKGYARSAWCLAELVLMLQTNAKIIPVFYQVEPWELRYIEKGKGVYAEAFLQYQEKGRYLDKLEEWKAALQQISYTAGHVLNPDSSDSKDIVCAVEKEVQRTRRLHVAMYPVGLQKLVKDFERRCLDKLVRDFERECGMKKAAKEKVNVVGIFGMGGVGKTTLSKELFNQKRSKYTRASFLFDVREACATGKLTSLQSKLLKDIFGEDQIFHSSEEGTNCLRDFMERSSSLSFLIVLDDIDHVEQLDALLPMDILNKHGNGNHLVIITTRDVGVLVSAEIDVAYHLRGLDREDGKELFCRHAFKQSLPLGGYEDLVEAFVNVCGGLPLSLIVLGRHVSRRPQWYWQDELGKAKETLPTDIKQRLKISIDRLDDVEKQIFMDIACFFIGESITKAMLIWEGSGWRARRALETLKERCLVEEVKEEHLNRLEYKWESTLGGSALRMHDHLRDLGREMADELSYPHRVWRAQDLKSLESNGFQNILTQTKSRIFHSIVDKSIGCGITYFLGKPKDGSDASLLWLQLEYLSSLPLDLNSDINSSIFSWIPLQNLQCLRISNGCFQKLWQSDVQAPFHLEELQIRDTFLEEFPDLLGKLSNMRKLVLHAKDIQTDIWSLLESLSMNLHSLKMVGSALAGDLAFNNTSEETTFQSLVIYDFKLHWEGELALNNKGWCETVLREVEYLEINGYGLVTRISINENCCRSLKSLKICEMQNLIEVDLARIKTLNCLEITDCEKFKKLSATSDLCKLVKLKISECLELEELRLAHLSCLEKITIENCNHLKSVLGISNLAKLVELKISGCKMLEFECSCLNGMKCLERLSVDRYVKDKYFQLDGCKNLKTIMFDRRNIEKLSIRCCAELEELPDLIGPSCLKRIIIDGCGNLKYLRLHGLENLESLSVNMELRQLDIIECSVLEELSSLDKVGCLDLRSCKYLHTVKVARLKQLIIRDCPALWELPSFARVSCLEEIEIESCEKLQSITLPTTFNKLDLQNCKDLQRVAVAGDLTKLKQLIIRDCPALEELPSFARVSCLEEIEIKSCRKLQSITLPTTFNKLDLQYCKGLQRVAVAGDLTKLKQLIIRYCRALEELPSFAIVSCVEEIEIESCEKLQSITLPTTFNKLDLQNCKDLQRIAVIADLTKLTQLIIKHCPALEQLPSISKMSCLEVIEIEFCEKLQNIMLPTTLIRVSVKGCKDLQGIERIADLIKLTWLCIAEIPKLKELPILSRLSCLEEIKIGFCEKLQNIMLPTTIIKLDVESCRDLQRVSVAGDLSKLKQLIIRDCHALEELPSPYKLSCLEEIKIGFCEKLQNIMLPPTVIWLDVQSCRDLQIVAVADDLTKLKHLIIRDCPALNELPSFARLSCLKKIEIESCEKLQNITPPTTLISLTVKGCRILRRIAGLADLTKLEQLCIAESPELELPSLSRLTCLERIVMDSCENLQNASDFEELHVPEFTALTYCSNAVTRHFIDKWKSVPKCTCLIGKAVDGAESSLNEHMFSEANIGVDAVIEITSRDWSGLGAEIVCFMVVIDSSTLAEDVSNVFAECGYDFKMRQGESIVTVVRYPDIRWAFKRILREFQILKKGFGVDLKEGEKWKSLPVLRTIVDRLYAKE